MEVQAEVRMEEEEVVVVVEKVANVDSQLQVVRMEEVEVAVGVYLHEEELHLVQESSLNCFLH